jgi:replicative DNA helicase
LRTGNLSKEDWRKLAMQFRAAMQISFSMLVGLSVPEMRAKARRLKSEQKGLDLLIVDYLQLMSSKGAMNRDSGGFSDLL